MRCFIVEGTKSALPVSSEFRLQYIRMLCEMYPTQVFSKLLKYDVPLDSCLNLVSNYHILDAQAYLEFRLGRVRKSVKIFEKVLW
jgi:hypothetical protein